MTEKQIPSLITACNFLTSNLLWLHTSCPWGSALGWELHYPLSSPSLSTDRHPSLQPFFLFTPSPFPSLSCSSLLWDSNRVSCVFSLSHLLSLPLACSLLLFKHLFLKFVVYLYFFYWTPSYDLCLFPPCQTACYHGHLESALLFAPRRTFLCIPTVLSLSF